MLYSTWYINIKGSYEPWFLEPPCFGPQDQNVRLWSLRSPDKGFASLVVVIPPSEDSDLSGMRPM